MFSYFFKKTENFQKKRVPKVPRKNEKYHVQKKFVQTRMENRKNEKFERENYRLN